jgi:hypothetical protein
MVCQVICQLMGTVSGDAAMATRDIAGCVTCSRRAVSDTFAGIGHGRKISKVLHFNA